MDDGRPLWRSAGVLVGSAALVVVVLTDAVLRHAGGSPADFTLFLGRFHPLAVHLPIGIVLLVGAAEAATLSSRLRPRIDPALALALPLLVAATAGAFVLGQLLARSGDFAAHTLNLHRRLELFASIGICLLPLAWAYQERASSERARWGFRALLGIALGVLSLGAHFGGTLTRGDSYLTRYAPGPFKRLLGATPEPAVSAAAAPQPPAAEPALFHDVIQPIFSARCVECHGADKVKGGLRLDSLAAIAKGGEDGAALIPGDASKSPLLQRVLLPASDDDHMPPAEKPALTPPEIAAIRFWIDRGANDTLRVRDLLAPAEARPLLERSLAPGSAKTPSPPSPAPGAASTPPPGAAIAPNAAPAVPPVGSATTPNAPPETNAPSSASTTSGARAEPAVSEPEPAPTTAAGTAPAILAEKCSKCHGATKQKGKLRVDSLAALTLGGKSGAAIVAGQPGASLLMQRVSLGADDDKHMPPKKEAQLSASELAVLSAWIRELSAAPHAAKPPAEPRTEPANTTDVPEPAATGSEPAAAATETAPAAAPPAPVTERAPPELLAGLPSHLALYPAAIAPLLHAHCAKCHAGSKPAGGLSIDGYATLLRGGDTGPALTPGKPEQSPLIRRINLPADDSDHMPPADEPQLTPDQVALVGAWVEHDGSADRELELGALPAPAVRAIAAARPSRAREDVAQAAPHATAGCGACVVSRGEDTPRRGAGAAAGALFLGLVLRRGARRRAATLRCR